LSSDSGAPAGLSEVRWTRTTVGGPNDLGGSVTEFIRVVLAQDSWGEPTSTIGAIGKDLFSDGSVMRCRMLLVPRCRRGIQSGKPLGIEDDWGVEDDSHGIVVNQRRTPYLACQLSVFMT
jgi:hypothetical protein